MSAAHAEHPASKKRVIIRASDTAWHLHWDELWHHRELLYFLVWRDIKVRYKQTLVGVAWAVVQPLAIALSLTLFLGHVVHSGTDGLPYPVFAYSGMVLWQLFSQGVSEASNSVVTNERLISKIYFPRLFVPVAAVLSSLLDFALSLILLAGYLVFFRVVPTAVLVLAPAFIMMAVISALGTGFWLSALNVKYRDVRYTLNFVVQFWFLASPIAYPISAVPEHWHLAYMLNPMVGAVEGFRWTLCNSGPFPWLPIILGGISGITLFITGLYYFRRTEDTFADFI